MTAGRSGSTSLMDRLAQFSDIAVPAKDVDCRDNELLHAQFAVEYCKAYSTLYGKNIASPQHLIEGFYQYHAQAAYAGFKSMPERHADFAAFVNRADIQQITLLREDVASTVASFVIAKLAGTWRRFGEPQLVKFNFTAENADALVGTIRYIANSNATINSIPNAIRLNYEDLCSPHFCSPALDDFFARKIQLAHPRPPVHGSSYVSNWDKFEEFVAQVCQKLQNDCTTD
jgi:hypothetical protein